MEVTTVEPIADDLFTGIAAATQQSASVFVIGVDYGYAWRPGTCAVKQHALGGEITFHVFVIIEVVAGKVGKDCYLVGNSIDAALFQGVRRDLHHDVSSAADQG